MDRSVTLRGWSGSRVLSLGLGAAMASVAAFTMHEFYRARFPASLQEAAACRAGGFFSCGNSALSPVAMIQGVPIGFFGFMLGALVTLGALLPSERLERTNTSLLAAATAVALVLVGYSVLALRSLCLPCTGFAGLTVATSILFWTRGAGREAPVPARILGASVPHLLAFGLATLVGAFGVSRYWDAKLDARTGSATARVVHQFFALDTLPPPSVISPYWTVKSTDRFQDATIRIVEFADLLCSDCRFFAGQMHRLEREFPGRINVAFQFFPLEARCNDVVTKDLHAGACELAYMAAYRPELFGRVHDEVFANFRAAKTAAWRAALARRYGLEGALADTATHARIRRLVETGAEYERTSDRYAHGIRSTPTLLVNGRMIIGTLPDEQMRAIFQAIVDRQQGRGKRFLENWVE